MAPSNVAAGEASADPGQLSLPSPPSTSDATKAEPTSTDATLNISSAPTLVPATAAPTTSNVRRATWDGKELVKAASLDWEAPRRRVYYLRCGERFTAPRPKLPESEKKWVPRSADEKEKKNKGVPIQWMSYADKKKKDDEDLKSFAVWCYRYSRCRIRTLMAKVDWRAARTDHSAFRDVSNSLTRFTLQHGIGPKEVEHCIMGGYNWTRDWDCVLALRQKSRMHDFKTTCAFYFKDLPDRLVEGVPWRDVTWTRWPGERTYKCTTCICCDHREWVLESAFIERGEEPRWAAVIAVEHMSRMESLDEHPMDIVNDSMCEQAELDIRTGLGRYRKAMFYRYGEVYGNDLARQHMTDQWREAFVVELEEFFGVLFRM